MPRVVSYILIGLSIANLTLWWFIWSATSQEPDLGLYFLSVGQGDAQLIRASRSSILIDAGPGSRVINSLDQVLPVYDRTIDIAILTHPNFDHLAGMLPILERYRVRLFIMTGVEYTLAEYQKLKEALKDSKIPILYAVQGEKIGFGASELAILSPEEFLVGTQVPRKSLNDTSIVARLSNPHLSALFTGDISSKLETQLDSANEVKVLKVPHHGSKYSSSREFLEKVSPEFAVIEVGRNSYGHPTQETLSRLAAIGAKVFRTDVDGTVSFLVDDGVVKIKTSE